MGKARDTGNLTSETNLFSDVVNDRVGIGTTNPTSKLWVNGDGYFTGILTASRIFSGSISGTALVGTALSISGISTFGGSISGTALVGTALSISGISTFGGSNGVLVKYEGESGIVTSANPGVTTVTYYGDGGRLINIPSPVMMGMIF